MLLSRLQDLIGGIYDVSIAHDVYDFLVTDRGRLPHAARSGTADEELLVAQPLAGSDEVVMSLYLDPALLQRLAREDPLTRLHAGNVADCWTALEGVSHFLYLAWNAGHGRPVSLLELEMQAEVDKYVASYWLLRRQFPGRFPAELRRAVSRGEPLCGEILPAPRADTVARAGSPGARWRGGCSAGRIAQVLSIEQRAQARAHRAWGVSEAAMRGPW
jgi:hypothetical protein